MVIIACVDDIFMSEYSRLSLDFVAKHFKGVSEALVDRNLENFIALSIQNNGVVIKIPKALIIKLLLQLFETES